MADTRNPKVEEIRQLLEQIRASGSFQSAELAERITCLASEVFGGDSGQAGKSGSRDESAKEVVAHP